MNQLLPSDILGLIDKSLNEGLTQSEIMLRQNCARKWYFRYVQRFKKKGSFSWALLFGDAMHRMLEQYYRVSDLNLTRVIQCPDFRFDDDVILMPHQHEEYHYWKLLGSVYFNRYVKHWYDIDKKYSIYEVEKPVELEYRGLLLRGKLDLVFKERLAGGYWVMDHKTTYDINESLIAGWQFRFQFLFYAWLYWKTTGNYPAGVYVNALKKPQERRSKKKQESVESFIRRIEGNIQLEPEKYFRRERLPFDKSILPRFEELTLNPILSKFEWVKQLLTYPPKLTGEDNGFVESLMFDMNSDYCQMYNRPCEYLELCQNAFQDFSEEYVTSEVKHPELLK